MFRFLVRLSALLVVSTAGLSAQTYYWTAFAGLPPQTGYVDGPAGAARFHTPTGLAGDTEGNIYVADAVNSTIRYIDAAGNVFTLAGAAFSPGFADGVGNNARFSAPTGLALSGALYVADANNHAIRRIGANGSVTTIAGVPGSPGSNDGPGNTARFNLPSGIAVDSQGALIVVDRGNHTIRRIGPDGNVSTIAGLAGEPGAADGSGSAARFRFPESITATATGFFITDRGNHTIRSLSPAGVVTTLAGSAGNPGTADGTGGGARFYFPAGIVAFTDGTLVVVDSGNHRLRLISPAGAVATMAGNGVEGYRDGPAAEARFFSPTGVNFSANGIVVSDTLNHTLRRLDPATFAVSFIAGGGGNFGRQDGRGSAARFDFPQGIAAHASGDLYVADTRGHSIRRIGADGTVVRLAGSDAGGTHRDGASDVASLDQPVGIAVAPDRTVYFTELAFHTIRALRPDGSIETIAGAPGVEGSTDGIGSAARFRAPAGLALDGSGNLFVSDTANHTIRRIAAGTRVVTTLAGTPFGAGSTNGTGASARFQFPRGLAVDAAGTLYVADSGNHTIRSITANGAVTTFAGAAAAPGATNGTTTAARFQFPYAIAIDGSGNLYVADTGNESIRLIKGGTVTTIGGIPAVASFAEGAGNKALFSAPKGIAVGGAGNLYVVQSGNNLVGRGALMFPPTIAAHPQALSLPAGGNATFSVTATGLGLAYQWSFNGTPIPGANSPTYTIANATAAATGSYSVTITNAVGTITSQPAPLVVSNASQATRLTNLSLLTTIDTPGDRFVLGFVVAGERESTMPLLIRAAGPSLAQLNVPDVMPDPQLETFARQTPAGENDNWGGASSLEMLMASVGAFPYNSPNSLDAALAVSPVAGDASVKVSGVAGSTGTVIAEIYDATPASSVTATTPRLVNVSVLKHLGSELTVGFTLGGSTEKKSVLIRAIGPTLADFGVTDSVADPQLELWVAGGTQIAGNDDWGGTAALTSAFEQVAAFPLPASSSDAALVANLTPGGYTVRVTGVNGTGVVLVEVYELP